MNRRPYDGSLRRLAGAQVRAFLTWWTGDESFLEELLDPVMVLDERRADLLLRYRDGQGNEHILHAEFQREVRNAQELAFRMVEYGIRVRGKYGQYPEQILVLVENNEQARAVPDTFTEGALQARFRIIRLWQEDPATLLRLGQPGLVPLLPLLGQGERLGQVLEQCAQQLEAVESREERRDLLRLTVLLASIRRGSRPVIEEFLRRRQMLDLLQDSELVQEWVKQAEAKARAEGEARGEARGRAVGERSALLKLLLRKFGPLPVSVIQALEAITDPERLNNLFDAALDASDLNSFTNKL